MEKKNFKVEMKGSLFVVTLECGCYSDWQIEHYLFSANSEQEAWELVKKWADDGGIDQEEGPFYGQNVALIWGKEKHQFAKLPNYEQELDWDTEYGDAYEVNIKRADVIYVNP